MDRFLFQPTEPATAIVKTAKQQQQAMIKTTNGAKMQIKDAPQLILWNLDQAEAMFIIIYIMNIRKIKNIPN